MVVGSQTVYAAAALQPQGIDKWMTITQCPTELPVSNLSDNSMLGNGCTKQRALF